MLGLIIVYHNLCCHGDSQPSKYAFVVSTLASYSLASHIISPSSSSPTVVGTIDNRAPPDSSMGKTPAPTGKRLPQRVSAPGAGAPIRAGDEIIAGTPRRSDSMCARSFETSGRSPGLGMSTSHGPRIK